MSATEETVAPNKFTWQVRVTCMPRLLVFVSDMALFRGPRGNSALLPFDAPFRGILCEQVKIDPRSIRLFPRTNPVEEAWKPRLVLVKCWWISYR